MVLGAEISLPYDNHTILHMQSVVDRRIFNTIPASEPNDLRAVKAHSQLRVPATHRPFLQNSSIPAEGMRLFPKRVRL